MSNSINKFKSWFREEKKKHPRRTNLIIFFLVFVFLMSSSSSDSGDERPVVDNPQVEQVVEDEEKVIVFTLEQKQADYKVFYKEYIKQGQVVVMTQIALLEGSNLSKEDFYLVLNKLSDIQIEASMKSASIEIPDSLKEYKKLSAGKVKLAVASRHFNKAIENFQKYLNTNDLEALSTAKHKSELGESQLEESINDVEGVGRELGIDIELIEVND